MEGSKNFSSTLRMADETEVFWHTLYENGSLMIFNTVSLLSTHPIHMTHLEKAVLVLLKRHQVLRSHLKRREESVYWEELFDAQSISLTLLRKLDIVGMAKGRNWLENIHLEQKQRFDESGVFWRICLSPSQCTTMNIDSSLNEDDTVQQKKCNSEKANCSSLNSAFNYFYRTRLLASFHHCIVDGLSRQNFWNELCSILLSLQSRDLYISSLPKEDTMFQSSEFPVYKESVASTEVPSFELGPPLSSIIGTIKQNKPLYIFLLFSRLTFPIINFIRKCLLFYLNPFSHSFEGERYDASNPLHSTTIVPIWLSVTDTKALISKCKKVGTSLNALLSSVAAVALAEMVHAKLSSDKEDFTDEVKVDFHSLMPYLESEFVKVLESAKIESCNRFAYLANFNESATKKAPRPAPSDSSKLFSACLSTNRASNEHTDHDTAIEIDNGLPCRGVLTSDSPSKMFSPFSDSVSSGFEPLGEERSNAMIAPCISNKKTLMHSQGRFWCKILDLFLHILKHFFLRIFKARIKRLFGMLPLRLDTWHAVNCRRWFHIIPESSCPDALSFKNYAKCCFLGTSLPNIASISKESSEDVNKAAVLANATSFLNSSNPSSVFEKTNSFAEIENVTCLFVNGENLSSQNMHLTKGHSKRNSNFSSIGRILSKLFEFKKLILLTTASEGKYPLQLPSVSVLHHSHLASYAMLMSIPLWLSANHNIPAKYTLQISYKIQEIIRKKLDEKNVKNTWSTWQLISGFIGFLKKKSHILLGIAPFPRPSPYLMSNAGKWDKEFLEIVRESRDSNWIEEMDEIHCYFTEKVKRIARENVLACRIELESSWSCVTQHVVGAHGFAHNIVTVKDRLCWSLQFHTNFTTPLVATEYASKIVKKLNQFLSNQEIL